MDPNSRETLDPAPLGVLVDRAIEITGKNVKLFFVVTLLTLGLQLVIYFFAPTNAGIDIPALIFPPFITALANIRCALDLRDAQLSTQAILAWALRRVAAVIFIDFVFDFAFLIGCAGMLSGDAGDIFTGILTVLFTSTLVFADVHASVEPQKNVLLSIPVAFMRSIALSWQNGNMVRVLLLALINIALYLVSIMLQQLLLFKHVKGALFLANVPLSTLFVAPVAVLTTVLYFDCVARERRVIS